MRVIRQVNSERGTFAVATTITCTLDRQLKQYLASAMRSSTLSMSVVTISGVICSGRCTRHLRLVLENDGLAHPTDRRGSYTINGDAGGLNGKRDAAITARQVAFFELHCHPGEGVLGG